MNVGIGPGPGDGSGRSKTGEAGDGERPLKQVRLLLPVWGESFIVQFLLISLPTFLAPGNLPAIAAQLPCTFVFQTNTDGADILRRHPAIAVLKSICDVEFDIIDDLITGDNYSTTLTLGFARAIKAQGQAMLDTCFVFLISDYIMADGSLANIVARIRSGYNGVLAGNFQVVEEDAKDSLLEKYETGDAAVAINARELIGWALDYLHPMTLANTVNFPLYHSAHSNRLFWRVDRDTMIGRFYLMHMVAIRPEVLDFEIGSSCDYSFIPEMCPSGNVHVVAESDEYVVVEMQRRSHEESFIRLGSVDPSALAGSLAEWTTERHRLNAHVPVTFRAAASSANLRSMQDESQAFVDDIEAKLPAAKPFRDHPYWIGAIAAHRRGLARVRKAKAGKPSVKTSEDTEAITYHSMLYALREFFLGRPSAVRPWHPRWPDYRMLQGLIRQFMVPKGEAKALLLTNDPAGFRGLLSNFGWAEYNISIRRLLELDEEQFERLLGTYRTCLLILRDDDLDQTQALLSRIKPLLAIDDNIVIMVVNGRGVGIGSQFNHRVLLAGSGFFDRGVQIETAQFVSAGWITWLTLRMLRNAFTRAIQSPFQVILCGVPIVFLLAVGWIGNLFVRRIGEDATSGLCSSMGVVLRMTEASDGLPVHYGAGELVRSRARYIPKSPGRTKAAGAAQHAQS